MDKALTNRMILPDVLKGTAVLLMIQVHLMELFATQDIYHSIWGKVSLFLGGPPAAPIFMAVMGYFLAKSGAGTLKMILRGLKLLLYGFLLNIGLNLNLFFHILRGELQVNWLSYVFGVDILFLAGLSIIIIAFLRLIFRDSVFYWLLSAILVAAAVMFIPVSATDYSWLTFLEAYFYKPTWWSYFPVFPWLAYPLAGYCFYLFEKQFIIHEIPSSRVLQAAAALVILFLVFSPYGMAITTDLHAYYHHGISYFLWTLLFMGAWLIAFRILIKHYDSGRIVGYLQWTGRNVTAFYVFQWLIIGNLATVLYQTVNAIELVAWFVGITLSTSILVWLYGQLKGTESRKKLQ